jgi:hypothetical protein
MIHQIVEFLLIILFFSQLNIYQIDGFDSA